MDDREDIRACLLELIGEEGCGAACTEPEIYRDEDGWKLRMEGFMEPWNLGCSLEEAKSSLREYARMGYGLA